MKNRFPNGLLGLMPVPLLISTSAQLFLSMPVSASQGIITPGQSPIAPNIEKVATPIKLESATKLINKIDKFQDNRSIPDFTSNNPAKIMPTISQVYALNREVGLEITKIEEIVFKYPDELSILRGGVSETRYPELINLFGTYDNLVFRQQYFSRLLNSLWSYQSYISAQETLLAIQGNETINNITDPFVVNLILYIKANNNLLVNNLQEKERISEMFKAYQSKRGVNLSQEDIEKIEKLSLREYELSQIVNQNKSMVEILVSNLLTHLELNHKEAYKDLINQMNQQLTSQLSESIGFRLPV